MGIMKNSSSLNFSNSEKGNFKNQRASKVNFIPKIKKNDLTGRVSAVRDRYNMIESPPMAAGTAEYCAMSITTKMRTLIMKVSFIIRYCFIVKVAGDVPTRILGCIVSTPDQSFLN